MASEFVFEKMFASLKEVLKEVERMIPFQEHPLAPFNRCESLEDIEFELRDFRYFSTWGYSYENGTLECESSEGKLVLSASDGSIHACCTIWAEEYDDSFAVLESAGWHPDHSTYEAGLKAAARDYRKEEDYPTHAPMHRRR